MLPQVQIKTCKKSAEYLHLGVSGTQHIFKAEKDWKNLCQLLPINSSSLSGSEEQRVSALMPGFEDKNVHSWEP